MKSLFGNVGSGRNPFLGRQIFPLVALFLGLVARADTFPVEVGPPRFDLYTDPYNGNTVKVGGFSGIYPMPGGHGGFYVVTDRGPAPDFTDATGAAFKTFLVPEFGPHILSVRLFNDGIGRIGLMLPLKRDHRVEITGLPTTLPATDVPFDVNLNPLPFDEDSLDAEGITVDPWGHFWVCEEYKPSVARVTSNGRVILRLVPAGTLTGQEQVPTFDILPGILAKRRNNRGLEGIAATSDGMLYAVMQRPLNNPSRAIADASRNVRVVAVNLNLLLRRTPEVQIRQLLYRIERAANGITLSDLFATGPKTLLVPERGTDKLFEADFTAATDLTPLENSAGRLVSDPTKTIEMLDDAGLAALGIVPATKRVIIESLTAIDPLLEKCEGVCVVGDTIVLTYDNDFNVAEASSLPSVPLPGGPALEVNLLGNNLPKIFTVPWH